MSEDQRETIDQVLRDGPFDLGGDVLVQRGGLWRRYKRGRQLLCYAAGPTCRHDEPQAALRSARLATDPGWVASALALVWTGRSPNSSGSSAPDAGGPACSASTASARPSAGARGAVSS